MKKMAKVQESKNRQERVMNAIIESAKAKWKIIEKYLECYWDIIERWRKEDIVKNLWTKIETVNWDRIITAIVKHTENTRKVIRDFF